MKSKAQGGKITDEDFRLIMIASMPKEWNIYISTLDLSATSAEIIAKLYSHDALLAHDCNKPSRHLLPPVTHAQMSYAPILYVAGQVIQAISVSDLGVGWPVSIQIGGRRRESLPTHHRSHQSILPSSPSPPQLHIVAITVGSFMPS